MFLNDYFFSKDYYSLMFSQMEIHHSLFITLCIDLVCVEVLRPSQPNGVMSSAVNLPNHTFTGQA